MASAPRSPGTHQAFVERYPKLAQAWEYIAEAGKQGPLDERTARLVRLGVAIGALREDAVCANVRKALSMGISREEIEQVVALSAGTLGLPATVAVHLWVQDIVEKAVDPQPFGTRPSALSGALRGVHDARRAGRGDDSRR